MRLLDLATELSIGVQTGLLWQKSSVLISHENFPFPGDHAKTRKINVVFDHRSLRRIYEEEENDRKFKEINLSYSLRYLLSLSFTFSFFSINSLQTVWSKHTLESSYVSLNMDIAPIHSGCVTKADIYVWLAGHFKQ